MRTLGISALLLVNVAFNVIANVGFKRSAVGAWPRDFLIWQGVGNVAGFVAVMTLTFVMRYISLSQALAFSWGLGFIASQVFGARFLLHEVITPLQWAGVVLIGGGLVLISLGKAG